MGRPKKATEEPKVDARRPQTRKRVPLHEQRNLLTLEGTEGDGFVYRFVNDYEDEQRITKFEKAGYEVVHNKDIGDVSESDKFAQDKTSSVVRKHVGGGNYAVLMRIRKEWYDEDQRAKQDRVDALEATMRKENLEKFGEIRNPKLDISHPKTK